MRRDRTAGRAVLPVLWLVHGPSGSGAAGAPGQHHLGELRRQLRRVQPGQPATEEPRPGTKGTSDRGGVSCPSCGASNPPSNRHCQECGARLRQGPLPTAPRPAVQATAGVRAALAISALLFAVVVVAILFNVFSGDDTPSSTTLTASSSTSPTRSRSWPRSSRFPSNAIPRASAPSSATT